MVKDTAPSLAPRCQAAGRWRAAGATYVDAADDERRCQAIPETTEGPHVQGFLDMGRTECCANRASVELVAPVLVLS
jgi:hypothetical protein